MTHGRTIRRRRRGQRGQALIEFAMFFLFLMYLLAGTTNLGGLLNDHLTVEYATRQGARTGAVLGNQGGVSGFAADCAVIGAIDAALINMPNLTLNKITIYKAGPDGHPIDTTTMDVYAGNSTCTVSGNTDTISPGALLSGYPPANRNNQPYIEDSLGVQLDYTYTFNFPLLPGGSFNASDYSVMPVDPVAIPSPIPTPTPNTTATPTP